MARSLLTDELWAIVEPLLPPTPPRPKGGRPRVPDRACLTGFLVVLRSGIPWDYLPQELGGGSGVPCWRRRRNWQQVGVWDRLHRALLDRLGAADQIDWERACLDSASAPVQKGGQATGPDPTNRGNPGTKRHGVVDRRGTPLAVCLTGANRHDAVPFAEPVDAIPPIKRPSGQRRNRPAKRHVDTAYDCPRRRRALTRRPITVRIARKGGDSSARLGRHRWVVDRTLAWPAPSRRWIGRDERWADIHHAFLSLGCALSCWNARQCA